MADLTQMLRLGILLFVALVCGSSMGRCAEPVRQVEPPRLRVLRDEYPRAYFFRQAERPGKDPKVTFADWEATYSRLMGIQGKALEEELPGLSRRNIDFFTRFKQRHAEQLVLLHFNGNARDPRWETDDFFAGHWIYFNGAKIVADVPAEVGETEIQVSDARLFHTGVGRFRDRNEDVGLCALDAQGKPNWHESEQVQLLAVDVQRNVIRVRRGCYGTKPRVFSAGHAYAAAHIAEGPWGAASQPHTNLLWFYNLSTVAPRDQQGRSAADVLIDDLSRRFQTGGQLASFDGLQFDVLFFTNRYHRDLRRPGPRGMDADADGRIDQAVFKGVNTYGIGVVEFCRRLRAAFPADKLLLADGMSETNQRAFGILNGIESEGFPHLNDREMRDWSGGLNRHWFWAANARPPVFNYINHKYVAGSQDKAADAA